MPSKCDRGVSGGRPHKEVLISTKPRTIALRAYLRVAPSDRQAVLKESLVLSSQRQVDPQAADC